MAESETGKPSWQYEHEMRVWAETTESNRLLLKGVLDFAMLAIRSIILINGGAAVAILAFLGQIVGRTPAVPIAIVNAGTASLMYFVAGAGLGVFCACLAYLAQVAYSELPKEQWVAELMRWAAVAVGLFGVAAFAFGAWVARGAFIAISKDAEAVADCSVFVLPLRNAVFSL